MSKAMQAERKLWSKIYIYDDWMENQGLSTESSELNVPSPVIGVRLLNEGNVLNVWNDWNQLPI
jgi:hypothetical protein